MRPAYRGILDHQVIVGVTPYRVVANLKLVGFTLLGTGRHREPGHYSLRLAHYYGFGGPLRAGGSGCS